MSLFSRLNPTDGISDFISYIRQPTPHRWPILIASCLASFVLIFWITKESVFVPPDPPKVIYIKTFAPNRTDAEIRASNVANQKEQDERQAVIDAANQRAVDAYRSLGKATGLDVDTMEADARAEQARDAAAQREKLKELYGAGKTSADQPN